MSSIEKTLQIAQSLVSQGHWDTALSLLQPLEQSTPLDTRALNFLGSVQLQTGRLQEAIHTLGRAASMNTGSGIPCINLGHALRKAQRFHEAVEAFRAGTTRSPQEPEGYVGLGEALLESSQFGLAHQAFAQALSLLRENAHQRERAQAGHFATAPFWWQTHRYGPVELRPFSTDDIPFFAECCADRAFMERFNALQTPTIDTAELASRLAQENCLTPVQRGHLKWVLWDARTHQRIGLAGIPSLQLLHRRAEVAIGVRGPHARAGFGIAGFMAVLDFTFGRLGIHKVQAQAYHTNLPALKQLRALGFVQEGVLTDQLLLANGQWLHLHSLALFQPQWRTEPRLSALRQHFHHDLPAEP
jgi:RimJ/RimL family protein N-acetyltransferase